MALLAITPLAWAENSLPTPNWDRDLAIRAATSGADEQELDNWYRLLRAGDSAELLHRLSEYSNSRQRSTPVRERQMFSFTLGLADFPATAIPAGLLDFLETYSPQTLVPQDEDPSSAVPLYNISGAAQRVRHGAERQSGEIRSVNLLISEPGNWIPAYLAASVSARRGFLDALDNFSEKRLEIPGWASLQALRDQPDLAAVASRFALVSGDPATVKYIVQNGRGAELAPMLRTAATSLSRADQADLLLSAIESAPPENAALAIALLAPGLSGVPEVTNTLFDLLEDAELGSTAALALARHPDPAVKKQLDSLAAEKGLIAKRARMALDLSGGPQ